ncbi:class II lanthipeptide, LchA2/BrtA2 family [Bacillus pseudomycoides]|uniref:class II lanthipeptide, LchA2/BrtA2 family n=1 Tax=Bacillus pseudomycoides TaxID=64104 RepID=UPI001BB0A7A5
MKLKKNIESEKVLKKLTEAPNVSGGTTIPCGIGAVTIDVSIGLCPTTKCTTRCGKRG